MCGLERYFFSYAVLNKLNAFFADPKESRINWDKTKEKKSDEAFSSMLKLQIDKLGQI